MNTRTQKRLAIGGALLCVAMQFLYKGFMISVAFTSRPACVVVDETAEATPARRAC